MDKKKYVSSRVLSTVIIFLILYIVVMYGVPHVFGVEKPFMIVVSSSMEPTLHVNDLIIVSHVNPRNIKVGDIIVFRSPIEPNMLIVHRVIEVIEKNGVLMFKTKGDNNPVPDPWVVKENYVIGKVIFSIPYIGIIIRVIDENLLIRIWIIGILIVAIIYLEYKEYLTRKYSKYDINET